MLRTQRVRLQPEDGGTRVLAPVTDRGDVIGVLEMLLPAQPEPAVVDYIGSAAHALEPAGCQPAQQPAQRRHPPRAGCPGQRRALRHARADQFVTGQLLRVDLTAGTAAIVNAGHPTPLRLRDGRVEVVELAADPPFGIVPDHAYRLQPLDLQPGDRLVLVTDGALERHAATADVIGLVAATRDLHPREVVQDVNRAVLGAVGGTLRDDATVLCLDWYGGGERDRDANGGANRRGASGPRSA